jgi:hypothetical protein
VTAAEAIAVADLEETNRLAAEVEALVGGALTMALAQEAEPGDPARVLARTRAAPVSEAHSINRAEILTVRTGAVAEAAEVAAAEAAAAEAAAAEAAAAEGAAAVEVAAAAEAAAAAGAAAKAAANVAALAPELSKDLAAARAAWPRTPRRSPGGPCLVWGARGIESSRRVAQQRGSKRGIPGREIDTDQSFEIT